MVLVIGIYPKKRGGGVHTTGQGGIQQQEKNPKPGKVIKQKVSTYRTSPNWAGGGGGGTTTTPHHHHQ
jgi:hypothetical protein